MSEEQRRFIWFQVIAAALFNLVLNGVIAWLMFHGAPPMPMWARGPSVGFDTVGTSFFLPLITCLVLTKVVRGQVAAGKAPALAASPTVALWRWLPHGTLARGAVIGLTCALSIGPATAVALQGAGFALMTGLQIVWFKALYGAALAALVTVPITHWALSPAPPRA